MTSRPPLLDGLEDQWSKPRSDAAGLDSLRPSSLSTRPTTFNTPAISAAATASTRPLPNPLSSKVTSVLSTLYADVDFRDALALLDTRQVQNTAHTRRHLRLDVQREVIDRNGGIIDDFGRVAEQLARIGSTIDKLNRCYGEMRSHISAAQSATARVLVEASSLLTQRRQTEEKQVLLNKFRVRFVLTPDEIGLLTWSSDAVDGHFFAALNKAQRISKDCEILLGFENQTLGSEIMEQTSKHLDMAFEKLFRWIQREFKTFDLENPRIGSSMPRALRVLAERPAMFQACLAFIADARELVLADAFHVALTGTTPTGQAADAAVKPIELMAHDPLRYVGDMLAWMHATAVGEREALEVLAVSADDNNNKRDDHTQKTLRTRRFVARDTWRLVDAPMSRHVSAAVGPIQQDDQEDEDSSSTAAEEFDATAALNELVDRALARAALNLRRRVEQVLQTNDETTVAYKLANLVRFYRATFVRLLGRPSRLVAHLRALETEARRQSRALMRDSIAELQLEPPVMPDDVGLPDLLHETLEHATAILKTYETSLTAPTVGVEDQDEEQDDLESLLAECFDPYVSRCYAIARASMADDPLSPPTTTPLSPESKSLGPTASFSPPDAGTFSFDASIFLISSLSRAVATLRPFVFARTRTLQLESQVDRHTARLCDLLYHTYFRAQSGLDALITIICSEASSLHDLTPAQLDALAPLLEDTSLARMSHTLDDFLPSAVMDAMEQLHLVQDARRARGIVESAADRFCRDFERVERVIVEMGEKELIDAGLRDGREGGNGGYSDGEEEAAEDKRGGRLRELFPRTLGEIRVLLS